MSLTAGLDIGSTTTKVALVEDRRVVASGVAPTGASCKKTARSLYNAALESVGRESHHVARVVSTGYGRRLVDMAQEAISELTANAAGATFLSDGTTIRTVIDVGGQDSKVLSLDESGKMVNFAMNDKCAAGTGRFLEQISRVLEVELEDLGRLSSQATEALTINSVCTVFAETEVVSLLAQGKRVEDIIAGIHASIAKRIVQLARGVGVREPVFFDGGTAQNHGLRSALEQALGVELIVPDDPQIATAIGAALIAADRVGAA